MNGKEDQSDCGCHPTYRLPRDNGTCGNCGGWLPGERPAPLPWLVPESEMRFETHGHTAGWEASRLASMHEGEEGNPAEALFMAAREQDAFLPDRPNTEGAKR